MATTSASIFRTPGKTSGSLSSRPPWYTAPLTRPSSQRGLVVHCAWSGRNEFAFEIGNRFVDICSHPVANERAFEGIRQSQNEKYISYEVERLSEELLASGSMAEVVLFAEVRQGDGANEVVVKMTAHRDERSPVECGDN
ncbi:hypothetical protein KC344_g195 [Hortaea werneckii]|nr:hypothetical protein KC344_g195 [Hortaea werneckii]